MRQFLMRQILVRPSFLRHRPITGLRASALHAFGLPAMLRPLLASVFAASLALASGFAQAQAGPAPSAGPAANATAALPARIQLEGNTMDKQAFKLEQAKGKVVLLMFWSTDCAVCRDLMKELRENVQGWANQPFELVLVSVDSRIADVEAYNAIINKAVPSKQRFVQLWARDASYKDSLNTRQSGSSLLPQANTLPLAFVIDKTGKPVKRYAGRIPAQAWDDIADLL